MKKKILSLCLLCGLLCLSSVAQVGATSYSASAEATGWVFFYNPDFGLDIERLTIQDNKPGPTPPVAAAVSHQFEYDESYCNIEATGTTTLLKVTGEIIGGEVEAKALSHYERNFTHVSQILISYDYYLYCQNSDSGPGHASGTVSTKVQLIDKTNSSVIWSHNLDEYGFTPPPEPQFIAGTMEAILPLITGHEYSLSTDVSLRFSAVGGPVGTILERRVYGTAYISDLSVSAVPLPGAVLLLGAGLGRLAIYSRRKMNAKN